MEEWGGGEAHGVQQGRSQQPEGLGGWRAVWGFGSRSKVINCRIVNYTVACFLYSIPWVDPDTPSKFLYRNMKREWSDESKEEPKEETDKKPEETWVLDPLSGLKIELKQEPVSPVLPEDYKAFNMLPGKRTPQRAPPILFF